MKIHTHDKTDDDIVKDGESVYVPLIFMDSAQRAVHDEAFTGNGQSAFEQRICDAWKNSPALTADAEATNDGQSYEERITNAWKNTPQDCAA